MKVRGSFHVLAIAGIALIQHPPLAAEISTSQPRYNFSEGVTNAYRVTLESRSQSNPMNFEGVIVVGVRSVEDETATVFFRGRIQPKAREAQNGRFRPMPPFGPRGPFGGGMRFEPWRITSLPPFNEAEVDSSGRVLRVAGLQELPKPLDSYAEIFFQTIPTTLTADTRSESIVMIEEDGSGRSRMPGGYYPGGPGGGSGRLSGVRQETVHVAEKSEKEIRFEKTTEFKSFLKTDDDPRLLYTAKTETVFDPVNGSVKSVKIDGSTATSTLDMIQKSSLVLRAERLDGEELAREIAAAADKTAPIADLDLDKVSADLKSDNPEKRSEIAQRLLNSDLEQHAAALLPIVLPFVNENEQSLKLLAVRVLAKAASREHVPLLLRLLKQEDYGQQHEAIQALRRLKDRKTIQPLADMIAYGANNAGAAAEALSEFGPVVEDAALALLKEKHADTRRNACQILQKSGTSKSIEALQAIVVTGDPNLISAASEAIRGIRNRDDESAKLVF